MDLLYIDPDREDIEPVEEAAGLVRKNLFSDFYKSVKAGDAGSVTDASYGIYPFVVKEVLPDGVVLIEIDGPNGAEEVVLLTKESPDFPRLI